MDFSGIYAGVGTIIGVAIAKYTSSKADKQLLKSEGENGSSTIRKILERTEERVIGIESDMRDTRHDVRRLGERMTSVEAKQDVAAFASAISTAASAAAAATT